MELLSRLKRAISRQTYGLADEHIKIALECCSSSSWKEEGGRKVGRKGEKRTYIASFGRVLQIILGATLWLNVTEVQLLV